LTVFNVTRFMCEGGGGSEGSDFEILVSRTDWVINDPLAELNGCDWEVEVTERGISEKLLGWAESIDE